MTDTNWTNNIIKIKDTIDNMLLELDNCTDAEEKARLNNILLELDALVRVL